MRTLLSQRLLLAALLAVVVALTLAPEDRSQSAVAAPFRSWYRLYIRRSIAGSPPAPWRYQGTYPSRRAALDAAEVASARGYEVWIRPAYRWYDRAPERPGIRPSPRPVR
jgi:hypothetical protein